MFTFVHAIVLGIVEGITEFLPISSTGHLILTSTLFNIIQTDFVKTFEIFIQLGAIMAVLVMYGKRIFRDYELDKRVIAGFIPTAVIGLVLYKLIKKFLLGNAWVVVVSLIVGGLALIVFEKWYKKKAQPSLKTQISYKDAVIIGVAQSLAIIPGVSRSAATIVGGLILGYGREKIVEFSFLLAIPTMAAASGLDLLRSGFSFTMGEWELLAAGFVMSFVVAWFAVKWLLGFVRNHTFFGFGIYRILVAVIYLFLVLQ